MGKGVGGMKFNYFFFGGGLLKPLKWGYEIALIRNLIKILF